MKKLLLASTALVVSAGVAAAQDFSFSTDGYMGIAYSGEDQESKSGGGFFDRFAATDPSTDNYSDWQYIYDLDFNITGSTSTDSGLIFGASIDFDDANGLSQQNGDGLGAPGTTGSIFLSGDFGTLTMGDIDPAAEVVTGDLHSIGVSCLGCVNETAFISGISPILGDDPNFTTRPLARYDYTVAGLTLSLSAGDDGAFAVGAGYSTDMYAVGLGYEQTPDFIVPAGSSILGPTTPVELDDNASHLVGYGSVMLAAVELRGVYGRAEYDKTDFDQYGISASTTFDAFTVSAMWRETDTDINVTGVDSVKNQFYGIGAAYDLGGGLALEAGLLQYDLEDDNDPDTDDDYLVADFGLSFSF